MINVRDRRRVYVNSDKQAVFDRLRKKKSSNFQGKLKKESDAIEEKEAIANLNRLDTFISDLDDDLVFFSANPHVQVKGLREDDPASFMM